MSRPGSSVLIEQIALPRLARDLRWRGRAAKDR
jgi:hypothetical protein